MRYLSAARCTSGQAPGAPRLLPQNALPLVWIHSIPCTRSTVSPVMQAHASSHLIHVAEHSMLMEGTSNWGDAHVFLGGMHKLGIRLKPCQS